MGCIQSTSRTYSPPRSVNNRDDTSERQSAVLDNDLSQRSSPAASPVRSSSPENVIYPYGASLYSNFPPPPPYSYLPLSYGTEPSGYVGHPHMMAYPPAFPPSLPMSFHPHHYPGCPYSYASSASGATLNLDRGYGYNEKGCVISTIATVTGKPYSTVRDVAADECGYDGNTGLYFEEALKILQRLGTSSSMVKARTWSELPDLAIVSVKGKKSPFHAVVFERNEHGEFIYDWRNHGPVQRRSSEYEFAEDEHLEIG